MKHKACDHCDIELIPIYDGDQIIDFMCSKCKVYISTTIKRVICSVVDKKVG
jgi:hypothetical protein